jgi:hypothetical protein
VTFEPEEIAGDLTGDGRVDWMNLAILAQQWLWIGPSGNIDEDIIADGIVNFLDFAKIAEDWMAISE